MKYKEIQELKNKSEGELTKMLHEMRDELHAKKLDLDAGKVKNIHTIKTLRKNIARVLTYIKIQQHGTGQ